MTVVDTEKAYWQVPSHLHYRRSFQFLLGDGSFHFQVMPFGLSTAPFWFTRDVVADGLSCRRPRPAEWSLFLDVFSEDSGSKADFRGGPLRRSGGCEGFNLCILAPIRNPDFARSSFFKDLPKEQSWSSRSYDLLLQHRGHSPMSFMRGTGKNFYLSSLLGSCPFWSLRHGSLQISSSGWPSLGS